MIPWFVVNIAAALARPFGREVYVHGRYQDRGVRRISFHRRDPRQPRARRLRPYDGGPLVPGQVTGVSPIATVRLSEVDRYPM